MLNNLRKPFHLPPAHHWDSMFDSMLGKFELFPGEELNSEVDGTFRPEVEVTDQAVVVRIAMAGFSKNEITVEIENDVLHVHAERTTGCNDEKCKGKKMLYSPNGCYCLQFNFGLDFLIIAYCKNRLFIARKFLADNQNHLGCFF